MLLYARGYEILTLTGLLFREPLVQSDMERIEGIFRGIEALEFVAMLLPDTHDPPNFVCTTWSSS